MSRGGCHRVRAKKAQAKRDEAVHKRPKCKKETEQDHSTASRMLSIRAQASDTPREGRAKIHIPHSVACYTTIDLDGYLIPADLKAPTDLNTRLIPVQT